MVSVRQVKAARALLGWSQAELARQSGISEPTIARLESEDGDLGGRKRTVLALVSAIEKAGIEFVNDDGVGAVLGRRHSIQPDGGD